MIAGKSTNHQDHVITFISFNTTKTIVNTSAIPIFTPPDTDYRHTKFSLLSLILLKSLPKLVPSNFIVIQLFKHFTQNF